MVKAEEAKRDKKQDARKGNWLRVKEASVTVPGLHSILQKQLRGSQVQHRPFQV